MKLKVETMILPFSTHINGQPTYFVEKIHKGLILNDKIDGFYSNFCPDNYNFDILNNENIKPKLHTLRDDLKDRWQRDKLIHFFINNQKPNMFQFAPVLPVIRVQSVYMSYRYNDIIDISINGNQLHNNDDIMNFVHNDGFDTWEDFFNYFYPKIEATPDNWYTPKLIHWTGLKY
jgi:hypothetical protein